MFKPEVARNHRWRQRSGGGEDQEQGEQEEVKAEYAAWYIVLAIVLAEGSKNDQKKDTNTIVSKLTDKQESGGEDHV